MKPTGGVMGEMNQAPTESMQTQPLSVEDERRLTRHFSGLPFLKSPDGNSQTNLSTITDEKLLELCTRLKIDTIIAPKLRWISDRISTISRNLQKSKPMLDLVPKQQRKAKKLESIDLNLLLVKDISIRFHDKKVKPIFIEDQLLIDQLIELVNNYQKEELPILLKARSYDHTGFRNQLTTILCANIYDYLLDQGIASNDKSKGILIGRLLLKSGWELMENPGKGNFPSKRRPLDSDDAKYSDAKLSDLVLKRIQRFKKTKNKRS